MPERKDEGHVWVAAATITLPSTVVRMAYKRGIYRLRRDVKVAVEEVYCQGCRKSYGRAADEPCVAKRDKKERTHLTGGPPGDKRKRRTDESDEATPQAASG